uniref:Uncharacterized protein n=1 Tax=Arundo donax TaxID=35708 RepID=A0A0A9HMQ0_ARUDO
MVNEKLQSNLQCPCKTGLYSLNSNSPLTTHNSLNSEKNTQEICAAEVAAFSGLYALLK